MFQFGSHSMSSDGKKIVFVYFRTEKWNKFVDINNFFLLLF